jgi:N utilization substance protein B
LPRSRWRTCSNGSMARTRIETRARARALQALYAWDMRGGTELERVASQVWDDLSITPDERRVAGPIVRLVAQKQRELDAELSEVTTNWRMERIGAVERCVLRMAAAELTIGETPPRVVIQEAVTLAERFGSAQSAKFVNGVLDALARRMGRM